MPKRDNTVLLDLYSDMQRIRSFEERIGELFLQGVTAGSMLHLSIGEEAVAGVCRAMRKQDSFTTHHRGHGIFLARGAAPDRMLAEICGKEAGYCKGKGGSMHIADMGLGHLGANAIVGGGIPHVVGAGLTYKTKKMDRVSVAFFGDGAMQQGLLYESMNLAALWKLPVIFCCVNNQYGMGTRIDRATANTAFDQRARAFGLEAAILDGLDVEDVFIETEKLIDGARDGKPAFISLECYRFHGHARKDKSPYRSDDEESKGREKDSVRFARQKLLDSGKASEKALTALDAKIDAEMDAAVEFALSAEMPDADQMFDHVYSANSPRPRPVRERLAAALSEELS